MRRNAGLYSLIASVALLALVVLLLVTKDRSEAPKMGWEVQLAGIDVNLRGLCVVTSEIAWIGGPKGTWGRTIDGGKTWSVGTVVGAEKLDFRDVEAFGEATAYVLSAGPGEESRIYQTTDGGATWTMQFKNLDPDGFYDALAFWDQNNGIAFGDPIKGRFQLLITADGGTTWKPHDTKNLPSAQAGESAFAASGTCLITQGANDVWFATGGTSATRVFHSADRGQHWTVHETPIAAGSESAGIFSIAFRDANNGMIVGGDYKKPEATGATTAVTADGGKTWTLTKQALPFRSCIAWAKERWIAVGTSGSDVSLDNGTTWQELDRANYNSAAFSGDAGWAVGPNGRIAKFVK